MIKREEYGYTGEVNEEGYPHGKGVFLWDDGSKYKGTFTNGKITGVGIYAWPNGDRYQGDFVEGIKSGSGTFFYNSIEDIYEGQFLNNHLSGKGTYWYGNGDRYEGEWVESKREGKGLLFIADNKSFFDCLWKGGTCVSGIWTNSSGHYYEGSFLNNRPHGNGIYLWPNGVCKTSTFNAGAMDQSCSKSASIPKSIATWFASTEFLTKTPKCLSIIPDTLKNPQPIPPPVLPTITPITNESKPAESSQNPRKRSVAVNPEKAKSIQLSYSQPVPTLKLGKNFGSDDPPSPGRATFVRDDSSSTEDDEHSKESPGRQTFYPDSDSEKSEVNSETKGKHRSQRSFSDRLSQEEFKEFPPKPPNPGIFGGDLLSAEGKKKYKEYMRKKYRVSQWENAFKVYKEKKKLGDQESVKKILQNLQTSLNDKEKQRRHAIAKTETLKYPKNKNRSVTESILDSNTKDLLVNIFNEIQNLEDASQIDEEELQGIVDDIQEILHDV